MKSAPEPFFPAAFPGTPQWDREGPARLAKFLSSGHTLNFAAHRQPKLSIIVNLTGKAHLSLLCLEALQSSSFLDYELLLVGNASSNPTQDLLNRCTGVKIFHNSAHAQFGASRLEAANAAQGESLLFLAGSALLSPGALARALTNFVDPAIGAVGGKILSPNGLLQEAGSILWSDGSMQAYGRGENSSQPEFNFRRPVDSCSDTFLLTPRPLFSRLSGFDTPYAQNSYAAADYCMKVWAAGEKVVYDPRAIVHHYESPAVESSSSSNESGPPLSTAQDIFHQRWKGHLVRHCAPAPRNVLRARIASHFEQQRILYIDDRVPHKSLGSGFPRSNDAIAALVRLGHQVTCVPFAQGIDSLPTEYRDIPIDVELLSLPHSERKRLLDYVAHADTVWISRPHNMSAFLDLLVESGDTHARIVYDAEAIFAHRERLSAIFTGREVSEKVLDSRLKRELTLANAADATSVVSEADQAWFRQQGVQGVHVLGHRMLAKPTRSTPRGRKNVLFVGAVHREDSPNADSMVHFCEEIWPRVRAKTNAYLAIAGAGTTEFLTRLQSDSITVLGPVYDVTPLYEQARLVVIPTRFAAGLPFKAHEAAAFGVPLVVSPLIATQLGWNHGQDLLVGNDPLHFAECCCQLLGDDELWTRLRTNALTRIVCDFSPSAFLAQVANLIKIAAEASE